ncbi:MAG: 4a-hydroxytetrahydrobiopterin dehydratase [Cyanobacteria bacterium P01_G01_bin.49]
MSHLKKQSCQVCNANSSRVTLEEIEQLKPQIPNWRIIEKEGNLTLKKVYRFPNFKKALTFTNHIGELAEQEGHHPALLTEWGKVTVFWWTHAINGLHKNDFIMAAKTDEICENL